MYLRTGPPLKMKAQALPHWWDKGVVDELNNLFLLVGFRKAKGSRRRVRILLFITMSI
jgi:hypothetical protein